MILTYILQNENACTVILHIMKYGIFKFILEYEQVSISFLDKNSNARTYTYRKGVIGKNRRSVNVFYNNLNFYE